MILDIFGDHTQKGRKQLNGWWTLVAISEVAVEIHET